MTHYFLILLLPLLLIATPVKEVLKIEIPGFPTAFNPSIVPVENGYLLSFRYLPDRGHRDWISNIGVIFLDNSFQIASDPLLLNTADKSEIISPQSEDGRLFVWQGAVFLIYNDNREVEAPSIDDRRDIFLAELKVSGQKVEIIRRLKLFHAINYENRSHLWEKNWMPIPTKDQLYLTYTVNPHEVLSLDCASGQCSPVFNSEKEIPWSWGQLRGGTPPILINDRWLAFFHSSKRYRLEGPSPRDFIYYFMGAYTISIEAPFEILEVSRTPIVHTSFYDPSQTTSKVIYPGGFVLLENEIHLVYGKNDNEIWRAVIDVEKLKNSLHKVHP